MRSNDEKGDGGGVEVTLLGFHEELIQEKALEDLSDMLDMGLMSSMSLPFIRGVYQYVIQVYKNVMVKIIPSYIINQGKI